VTAAGYQLVNLDCIVLAERPRISPFRDSIRGRIAAILQIAVDCVGLQAKTGEGVGTVGREEAIEARCVALVAQ
jgi:2-C-methyl-D-erythritol 2,4-cyclodiphosphate synthase